MSEDESESFVILDSSLKCTHNRDDGSLQADTPGNSLCSLGRNDLQECVEAVNSDVKNSNNESNIQPVITDPVVAVTPTKINGTTLNNMTQSQNSVKSTIEPNTGNTSGSSSLAASFIMGEINADVLKGSVYSQFPSLCSMEACAEDVVKLQTLMTEYIQLKQTLAKVNNTMKQYYEISRQWKEDMTRQEQHYRLKLQECEAQVETLRKENTTLQREVATKIEQIGICNNIMQKEHDELVQKVSEKESLINNMRTQIEKLEQQKFSSYEFVGQTDSKPKTYNDYVVDKSTIKELNDKLSKLLAENLELRNMQKLYIDEIDCLKVNYIAAEELIKQTRADVGLLKAKDIQNSEEIANLRQQVEIYKKDFEMERADREKIANEKEEYLIGLRKLQRHNQELIEAQAEEQKRIVAAASASSSSSRVPSKSTARVEERPILEPTGAAVSATTKTTAANNQPVCPICMKSFKTLIVLQNHVNDCLDNN